MGAKRYLLPEAPLVSYLHYRITGCKHTSTTIVYVMCSNIFLPVAFNSFIKQLITKIIHTTWAWKHFEGKRSIITHTNIVCGHVVSGVLSSSVFFSSSCTSKFCFRVFTHVLCVLSWAALKVQIADWSQLCKLVMLLAVLYYFLKMEDDIKDGIY